MGQLSEVEARGGLATYLAGIGGRATVLAACSKVVGLTVDSHTGGYAGEIVIVEVPGAAGISAAAEAVEYTLPVADYAIAALFGYPAHDFQKMILSDDKSTKRLAKQRAREVNTQLARLRGVFQLGVGAQGRLTVLALPDEHSTATVL